MKSLLISLTFIAACTLSQAQSVTYDVLEDNPRDMKNLLIGFDPFYGEAWGGERFNLGWSAWGIWQINNKVQAELNFRRPYNTFFDASYDDATTGFSAHNSEYDNLKPTRFLNAMGSFSLVTKEVRKPVRVVLNSSSSGGWTSTTYINPTANVLKTMNVRGGIFKYNSTIGFGDDGRAFGAVTTDDGETLALYGAYNEEGEEIAGSSNGLAWATNANATCLVGGIGWESNRNIVINADGYGRKKNSMWQEFYLDVMFAPAPTIADVSYGEHTFDVTGNHESALQTSNLGWRFGYRSMSVKRAINWGWNCEMGSRPGLQGKGFYLVWGVSLPVVGIKVPYLGKQAGA